jgi:hypothetical protein
VADPGRPLLDIIAWADLAAHAPEGSVGRVVSDVVERP